jgi:putative transposase
LAVPRTTQRYRSRRAPDTVLQERLHALAMERPRWGSPMLYRVLRREGWTINHKRVERVYREAGLTLRRRRRRSRARGRAAPRSVPITPNERWSMDFMSDTLASGRRFRCLTIVDDCTREVPAIGVDTSLPADRVIDLLDRLATTRGLPRAILVDNGPEFCSRAFDAWAYRHGITLQFIEPGKPTQNPFVESFNGTFRDECLNQHWFTSLTHARRVIEAWRQDYNAQRPHSSLRALTPTEFAAALTPTGVS